LIATFLMMVLALLPAQFAARSYAAPARVQATLNIGEKNFAEEKIIGDMYALLLAREGFAIKLHVLGSEPQHLTGAIRRGDVDIYPEYTGTGLQVLGIRRIITSPTSAYNIVKNQYEQRFHITWLKQSLFNDTNGVAVTQATARKYHLHTLSDLARVAPQLTFAALSGCKGRQDCLGGFQSVYGIQFKTVNYLDPAPLRYSALRKGQADAIEVFTTDGPIQADHLVVLTDDKHAVFPADHIAPLVRDPILHTYPQIARSLNRLPRILTTQAMIRLNGQVILQQKDPMAVARAFLKSKHLI
jgi:osmoprotectant transport system substrate-binding protein